MAGTVQKRPRTQGANTAFHEVAIAVRDGEVLWGSLPRRALGHVQEWRQAHVVDLEADWDRAKNRQPLNAIEPLE